MEFDAASGELTLGVARASESGNVKPGLVEHVRLGSLEQHHLGSK